jgi:hypothetical protein
MAAAHDMLEHLRVAVRQEIGTDAENLAHTCDVLTDTTLEFWPVRYMADLSKRSIDPGTCDELLSAVAVVQAKVAETLEARFSAGENDRRAIRLLVGAVVATVAGWWFDGPSKRVGIRQAIVAVRD